MPARERLNPIDQTVGYFIGLGVAVALIAFWLGSLEDMDHDVTASLLLLGLALVLVGTVAWLALSRPWEGFDDLKTPHYTGHHDAHTAHAAPAEHPADAEAVAVPAAAGAPDDLTQISGVGARAAEALARSGITTLAQVAALSPEALADAIRAQGVRLVGSTATWPEQAARLLGSAVREPDDLTAISGIGPKVQSVLYEAGIRTYEDLSQTTPDALRDLLTAAGLQMLDPEGWPQQAGLVDREDAG